VETKPHQELLLQFRLYLIDEGWCPHCLALLSRDMVCCKCGNDSWEEYYGDDTDED
jgi:hypothetical protein